MLDVTRLRVIDAVARLGSVTAAAKELHYTQPTVSHHLSRLEAETGAQLLASRAAEILGRIDAADAELAAHVGLSAGRVRLASFSDRRLRPVPQPPPVQVRRPRVMPTKGSNPGSATPPMTWSSCRRWSPPGWA